MRKIVLISLAVTAVIFLSLATFAFAGDRYIIRGDEENLKKVKLVEKKGAYIGIYMEDLSRKLKEKHDYPKRSGVWIMEVVEDSPAERAGLEDGDIIYTFGGEKVQDSKHLGKLVKGMEPGETVKVTLFRDGKEMDFKVELGENARQYYTINVGDDGDEIDISAFGRGFEAYADAFEGFNVLKSANKGVLGVKIHEISEDLAPYFDIEEGQGVLVLEVVEDSAAEKVGIRGGDVIVEVAGEEIENQEGLLEVLAGIDEDVEELEVVVVRKGSKKVFEVRVEDLDMNVNAFFYSPDARGLKHFKMQAPDLKESKVWHFKDEMRGKELELEKLKKEIELMEKRLKRLEKDKD